MQQDPLHESARVILVPLYHVEDPWDLPILAVLVTATKTRLQTFPDVSVAVSLLQELAWWKLSIQVIAGVLRGGADNLDALFR
jgi:hypothetical protein